MSLDKHTEDRIMDYLDGKMTPTELKDFEKNRQNDAELNETVTIMERMHLVYDDENWPILELESEKVKENRVLFDNDDIKLFSNKVKASQKRYENKDSTKTNKWLKYIGSIAAVGLIAFFINTYFNPNNSSEELFNNYYNTQDLPSFVVQNSDANVAIEAERLFKEQRYSEALKAFTAVNENSNTLNPNLVLYIAICNLELNNYTTSLNYLEELEQSNAIDFHKAYWFKALVYLKQDQKNDAIKNLKILSENKTYFNHEKANDLLDKLD